MKTGKRRTGSVIYVIVSKIYNIQALSREEEYALGFANMIGGKDNCFIIKTLEEKLEMDKARIENNMLFEWQNIWLSANLDMQVTEFLELKEGDMSGCMNQMMDLIDYYKFTDEEQVLVNKFVEVYDYYFVRDAHGLSAYDINEEINYELLIKLYLNTVKRNN